jgi:zinc transport system substrate-binding protein
VRLAAALAVLVLACSPESRAPAPDAVVTAGPLVVYTVNAPLEWMARRIGGDAVEMHFPSPADVDPAFWSPDGETVAAYQGADLILLNGAGYAGWVARATLPRRTRLDTSAGFRDRLISVEDAATHQHGPTGEHSHGETAFTTWLDPTLAAEQARAVAGAFADARPADAETFATGLAGVESDLAELDHRLAGAAASLGDTPILFSHPVYQYLERRYRLNGRSLHWEPDTNPTAGEWRRLETLLREHPARLMLWEAEPQPTTRGRLAALGVEAVVFAPCGNRCGDDWLAAMQANAARLEAVADPRHR